MTDQNRVPSRQETGESLLYSANIDNAYRRMLRRKNPAQLKRLNDNAVKEQASLSKYEIMHITRRALEDQKNRKLIKPEIYSTIKGRPYCLKLGQIDPTVDNFKGFYDTFYTNIYREEKDRPRLSLRQIPPPTPSSVSRNTSHSKCRNDDKENERQRSLASSKTSHFTHGSLSTAKKDSRRYFQENFTNFINDCSEVLESECGNKRRSVVKYPTVNPFKGRF